MKEISPKPICLACGASMEIKARATANTTYGSQRERTFYTCPNCKDNSFQTIKPMICPLCFQPLLTVRQNPKKSYTGMYRTERITLCSNLACHSYREGNRGDWFRTISHSHYPRYLDWNVNKNYFRFSFPVDIKFHNHLVELANRIIDAQGWKWEHRPELRDTPDKKEIFAFLGIS